MNARSAAEPPRGDADWRVKVPQVALAFWVVKTLCTPVGETGAGVLAAGAGLGREPAHGVLALLLLAALVVQLRSRSYTPWKYWLTVVLMSVAGTQLTHLFTGRFGASPYASASVFALLLALTLAAWWRAEGTLSIRAIATPRRELFYWAAILFAFALGTAVGDLAAAVLHLSFVRGAAAFGALVAMVWLIWRLGGSAVLAFWVAYVLTRPFGAALGDLLTQARSHGGLGMGALWTGALFLSAIVLLVALEQYLTAIRLQQPAGS